MPDRPETWTAVWQAITSAPTLQGALLASVIALLRILYDDRETRRMRIALESALCGCLTLCSGAVIRWAGLPEELAIAVGGAVGFLGVTALREFALRWLHRASGGKSQE